MSYGTPEEYEQACMAEMTAPFSIAYEDPACRKMHWELDGVLKQAALLEDAYNEVAPAVAEPERPGKRWETAKTVGNRAFWLFISAGQVSQRPIPYTNHRPVA